METTNQLFKPVFLSKAIFNPHDSTNTKFNGYLLWIELEQ